MANAAHSADLIFVHGCPWAIINPWTAPGSSPSIYCGDLTEFTDAELVEERAALMEDLPDSYRLACTAEGYDAAWESLRDQYGEVRDEQRRRAA